MLRVCTKFFLVLQAWILRVCGVFLRAHSRDKRGPLAVLSSRVSEAVFPSHVHDIGSCFPRSDCYVEHPSNVRAGSCCCPSFDVTRPLLMDDDNDHDETKNDPGVDNDSSGLTSTTGLAWKGMEALLLAPCGATSWAGDVPGIRLLMEVGQGNPARSIPKCHRDGRHRDRLGSRSTTESRPSVNVAVDASVWINKHGVSKHREFPRLFVLKQDRPIQLSDTAQILKHIMSIRTVSSGDMALLRESDLYRYFAAQGVRHVLPLVSTDVSGVGGTSPLPAAAADEGSSNFLVLPYIPSPVSNAKTSGVVAGRRNAKEAGEGRSFVEANFIELGGPHLSSKLTELFDQHRQSFLRQTVEFMADAMFRAKIIPGDHSLAPIDDQANPHLLNVLVLDHGEHAKSSLVLSHFVSGPAAMSRDSPTNYIKTGPGHFSSAVNPTSAAASASLRVVEQSIPSRSSSPCRNDQSRAGTRRKRQREDIRSQNSTSSCSSSRSSSPPCRNQSHAGNLKRQRRHPQSDDESSEQKHYGIHRLNRSCDSSARSFDFVPCLYFFDFDKSNFFLGDKRLLRGRYSLFVKFLTHLLKPYCRRRNTDLYVSLIV